MPNLNLLDIVNELCARDGQMRVASVDNANDVLVQRMVSCVNSACEELSLSFNWIWQLRQHTFIADKNYAYNQITQGYDLQVLTDGFFDRFTTRYLYNKTKKQIIVETQSDEKAARDVANVGTMDYARFIRVGDEIIFSPDLSGAPEIMFYYQTSAFCFEQNPDGKTYKNKFSKGTDKSVIDTRLVIPAALVEFKIAEGFETQEEQGKLSARFKFFTDYSSPKSVIYSHDTTNGYIGQITDMGLI